MLSKQDKLKYGEQLRRQMKQRQEKKKFDQSQKRGGLRKSPTDIRIPIEPQPYIDNKQSLQNKFQQQNIDYYGRPGGGAPNRQPNNQNQPNMQPQYNNYEQNQFGRIKTSQNYPPYQNQQITNQNYNYLPQQRQPPQYDIPMNAGLDNQQIYGKIPNQNYQMYQRPPTDFVQAQQQAYNNYNNTPYAPASFNNQNIPQNLYSQGQIQKTPIDRSYVELQQMQQAYQPKLPYHPQQRQYPQQYQNDPYQQPIQQINQKHDAYRQKTFENQQLMQIHKKGGRNLLQLQNMTIDQQQIKQKQKQQMRKQLQNQMKQAQQRKRQEQERIKRQQIEQQIKNQQYLLEQKKRFQQQQRKKNDKQRQLIQQNAKNLQQRKRLQQQAKQKALRQKMKQSIPQNSIPNSPKMKPKQKEVFSRQAQFQADQTTSEVSSSTVMQKAFNTGVSKQFFQNQRKKDQQKFVRQKNLQAVTEQIKKLKQHIDKQNQFFKKQILKVKLESQMAEKEKKKAEQQIQNLKNQLKKKMEDDNQRLFVALQRQESLVKQQQDYQPHDRNNQRRTPQQSNYQYNQSIQSLKPSRDEKLVKKQYAVPQQSPKKPQYNQGLLQSNVSEDGMMASLHGDSKKIPINLPDDKLSMSKLSDYARETSFFKNDGKSPYLGNKKSNLKAHESIIQQDQQRVDSRVAQRKPSAHKNTNQKDQLDKLVESRQRQRGGANWGELSSVNSDITKQIEQLLKKKDNPYRPPSSSKYDNPYNNAYNNAYTTNNTNERPNSRLSNAGKRALSRNGLQYEGASLGTLNSIANGGNGTLGTVDVDRINNRNDRRLNQLRNLGVQTINTNGDQQFSKLDMILNKYKQSRVM